MNAPRAIVYRALLDVLAVHDGLPLGVPTADNEAGWREALDKLAALVEAGWNTRDPAPSPSRTGDHDDRSP